jgi:cobalt-zinc-cadmium efflux system protein
MGVAHDHSHSHSTHPHHHHPHGGSSATKNVLIAFGLNVAFTLIEIGGSIWTGSVAIWADVIHDLGDSITLGMALILQKIAEKEANSEYTYGYARYSLLSALIAGVVLCLGSILIFYHSIPRFWQPHEPRTEGMIALAVLGVIANGFAFFRLRQGTTQNEKILSWHLFEDFAGWLAILLGAFVIRWTGAVWVDPLLACLISSIILYNSFKNLKTTTGLLLQRCPPEFKEAAFISQLKSNKSIFDIHDLHVWSLDGELTIMSLHLVLDPKINSTEVSHIKEFVRKTAEVFGKFHVTIEIENHAEFCDLRKG